MNKFTSSPRVLAQSPFIGKAGEYIVLAELLLREFNAALVAVDSGTDILTEKNNRLIRIQVKTRRIGHDKKTSFLLGEKTLKNKNSFDFLILVVRNILRVEEVKEAIFVFPRSVINKLI
ncbi:hypothetical protein K9N08_02590 [Candidatus Gracilibacteria bacterium]|nr:hypothetical protein [Candidatus Gracilibacteria bacterium]MCF7856422.1 hypothetical protein [Candidatus Gracilibacteria bacterium]MCF7896295.1 hypothetical protein [Candidatus Gracilibacteria bacterium]